MAFEWYDELIDSEDITQGDIIYKEVYRFFERINGSGEPETRT